MKRLLIFLILLSVLCAAGCTQAPEAETTAAVPVMETQENAIPQELPGVWTSANAGKLMMSETIIFGEDGSLEVTGTYEGSNMGTLYGTYRVEHNYILCKITEGATPFQVSYAFRIDGRELVLTDDDGDATYLRTS